MPRGIFSRKREIGLAAVVASATLYATTGATQPPSAPTTEARLQALERRVAAMESVSFQRRGEHHELRVGKAKLVVGPSGDVTVHSPTQVMLVSEAGGVIRLRKSMELDVDKPPVGRFARRDARKCNPPYVIDKRSGLRYIKSECLRD